MEDRAQNTREVNPSHDLAGLRRNPRDSIAVPDVGENLSLDELQFVQLIDGSRSIVNFQPSFLLQSFGIEYPDLLCPIAQEHFPAISGEAPPFP